CRCTLVEPVPAAPGIGILGLARQQHQPIALVSQCGDARSCRNFLRRLAAAVEKNDERAAAPARMAARHVDEVIARRPYQGRDCNPAMTRKLASGLEAPGLRRCAPKPPREK